MLLFIILKPVSRSERKTNRLSGALQNCNKGYGYTHSLVTGKCENRRKF